MLQAYSGDYQRASNLLKPTQNNSTNIDLFIFNVLIQSLALKTHSKNFLYLRDLLQNYNTKNVNDIKSIHQATERLNSMHVIKFTMAEVSSTMNLIMVATANSMQYKEYLWACFSMLPLGVAILYKEQVARDSLANLKAILSFQAKNDTKDS